MANTKTIKELCSFSSGHGFSRHDWAKAGLPIIRIAHLNGSRDFDYYAGMPEVDWVVEPGELLFAWAGTKGVSFGPTIWNGPRGVLNQHIFRVRPKDGVDTTWLYYALLQVTQRIEKRAHGFKSTLVHVRKSDIEGQRWPVPSASEQRRIVGVLGLAEGETRGLADLIQTKRSFKRGLMQQLLSGQKRFPQFRDSKWRIAALGDLVNYTPRKVPKPPGQFLSAGVRSHGKGVFLKKDFLSDGIALDELFELKHQDLVVNITFGWEGAVAIVPPEADGALVSHRFPTYKVDENQVLVEYLRHVIRSKRFVFDVGVASPGGAGRNRVLNRQEFLEIIVKIPGIEEQDRIAQVLNDCDREIDLLAALQEQIENQKGALLSRLLSGELKVPAPA